MVLRSRMTQHNFAQVPSVNIKRSVFNRAHGHKTTFDAGYLVPFYVDEALPGDTFHMKATMFARLATPIKPLMDNMYLTSFFFFVPNRLLWDHWQEFNGEQKNPDDTTDYLIPQMVAPASTGYAVGTLSDYFGLPTGIPGFTHSALWHRAYNLIWNEWFRDENLQDSVTVDTGDAASNPANYVLLRRGKRHDYFTSSLPWPQKGPSVELPLGGNAPVIGIATSNSEVTFTNSRAGYTQSDGTAAAGSNWSSVVGNTSPAANISIQGDNATKVPGIFADLSAVTAATINQLRQAFQIQKIYERDARGGTRYIEIIKAHFGVTSPDARLQRPEYLGGGKAPVVINPIAQTSMTTGTGDDTPQANLAAIGTLSAHGHGFNYSFVEHGVVIGLMCVDADLSYQQGLNKMWSRLTRFDFFWPELAQIGEQAVLNQEIYTQGTNNSTDDAAVFGYQERYAEYRYKPNLITGEMRSTYADSLDVWHLAQEFTALPALSADFIQSNPPIDRVIAVPSEPHFIFDSLLDLKCVRPMPVYGVPGYIDHFWGLSWLMLNLSLVVSKAVFLLAPPSVLMAWLPVVSSAACSLLSVLVPRKMRCGTRSELNVFFVKRPIRTLSLI